MNKKDLIKAVAEKTGSSIDRTQQIINQTLAEIMVQVKEGNDVALIGFGTFQRKHRPARKGRNPASGATMDIAASNVPAFKAGSAFKDIVHPGESVG